MSTGEASAIGAANATTTWGWTAGNGSSPPTWVWEATGPEGAPALLLLHGWMAAAALNWSGSFRFLGERFRVVAPNLRGHGRAGTKSPPFSVEGCADDVAGLLLRGRGDLARGLPGLSRGLRRFLLRLAGPSS